MGLEKKLRLWSPPSALMRQLRALTRHRENVLQMITMVNDQLHAHKRSAFPSPEVKRHLKKIITGFKAQVAELNIQIRQTIDQEPAVTNKADKIIDSIKGVRIITVATLIAETNQFLNFPKNQQLVKFAGYDVIEHQSGNFKGKERISRRGNYRIRRILHMPALNVVAYQTGNFPQFYQRIYDRNKIKMKGYVAVQRKLLCLISTLWKNDQRFDPHFKNLIDKRPAELQSV